MIKMTPTYLRRWLAALAVLVVIAVAGACSSPATVAPVSTFAPTPTAVSLATPTSAPTPTPNAVPTPVPTDKPDSLAPAPGPASTPDPVSTGTPAPAATPFPPQPHIMLRVVHVTEEWMPYASVDGWTTAVPTKESAVLKYYEAAIWDETNSVHLYAFPNDYDPHLGAFRDVTDADKIAHRERHAIRVHEGLPEEYPERSAFLRRAFEDFIGLLVERHPQAEHHLMYNGHGGPGGDLFAKQLLYDDADAFLSSWTGQLGKPLGVIDMGGPCNKGGYDDLVNFCKHARYYIASDLANGGYELDEFTGEKYYETDAETQYHRLLASHDSLEMALAARIDLRRKNYEYARNNQTRDRIQQASYVYSCAAFTDFSAAFEAFIRQTNISDPAYDLHQLLVEQSAPQELIDGFRAVFIHRVDNRDFFQWDIAANGMITPFERIRRSNAADG